MTKHISVIGSGFSGLSAGAFLARSGFDVTIFEKNRTPGGRARNFTENGFTFDMGPTWYWLPDVFERFFEKFQTAVAEQYELIRVSPSYRMYFGQNDYIDIPADVKEISDLFEKMEKGSAAKLKIFLKDAAYKYELGMRELIYKPALSSTEYLQWKVFAGMWRLDFFKSMRTYVRSLFKNPRIISILEFPVIFLGATPSETPAFYSMMNHADIALGTWYPVGGMFSVINSMVSLNQLLGVEIEYNATVEKIIATKKGVSALLVNGKLCKTDGVVASADYHHVEQQLLPENLRSYSAQYWKKRKMAPSSLIFYLGINKPIPFLEHHNLFFDESFDMHASQIYDSPQWPDKPAIYVSVNSKTDPLLAPEGCETLMILIPVASGLDDNELIREYYYDLVMNRLEYITGEIIRAHVVYKRSYAHQDFEMDYNAYQGNAYGLANTLKQTAIFKPRMTHKKVPNLFYCGQLTVPGPGVPPSIISGEIVANLISKRLK